MLAIWVWRTVAVLALVVGLLGVVLPVLPTVPFVLVAAWAGGKGWPALERYLLQHPRYGEAIRRWRAHGIVPRRAKVIATAMMSGSAVLLAISNLAPWVKWSVTGILIAVAVWLWLRPEARGGV